LQDNTQPQSGEIFVEKEITSHGFAPVQEGSETGNDYTGAGKTISFISSRSLRKP